MSGLATEVRGKRPGHRVAVIGAGWAGAAAAFSAREAHAEVVVVDGGVGASSLGGGALDDIPWDERERAARTLDAPLVARPDTVGGGIATDLAWIAGRLGGDRYVVPDAGAPLPLVATSGGRVRSASARDAALLDLAALPAGTRVIVPRVDRASWDAASLVRIFAADAHALARGITFVASDADVLRYDDERRIPDADLAARHDERARLAWLADQLRATLARAGEGSKALLLGPWLGLAAPRAASLGEALGVPVGEALAPGAATSGLRFERAVQGATKQAGIRIVRGEAVRIERDGARWRVVLANDESIDADGVVLAIGGLAGGGIVFDPPEHAAGAEGADVMKPPFRLAVECGVRVEARGDVGVSGSAYGPSFDEAAWPTWGIPGGLEVVGVRGIELREGLFAAGDAVASKARTVGEAVQSGRRAGALAAAR